jgi:hypothetical protein
MACLTLGITAAAVAAAAAARYAPTAGGARGDALVVATPHKVFTLAGDD